MSDYTEFERSATLLISDGKEMLRIAKDGFYVRGVKLEQDESEAQAVHDAFTAWLAAQGFPVEPPHRQGHSVPEGWKLVPITLYGCMEHPAVQAAVNATPNPWPKAFWKAALDYAPDPPIPRGITGSDTSQGVEGSLLERALACKSEPYIEIVLPKDDKP